MNDFINYYELLGISQTSTKEEIKKAYRTQAKKWHPDLNKDANAQTISKQLNEAKEILLDDLKRKDYDKYLEDRISNKYNKIKKETKKPYNNNDYESKTYTKWEYLKYYLKYFNIKKSKKILSLILVILETILCQILSITNYILAITIFYTKELIAYLAIMILVLYIINVFLINKNTNLFSSLLNITLLTSLIIIPELLLKILVEKTPIYISKLNIYLFKKSVNYKE